MRTTVLLQFAALAALLAFLLWRKPVAWLLTLNKPETPPGHKPKMRRWRNGVEVFD